MTRRNTAPRCVTRSSAAETFTGRPTEHPRGWTAWRCTSWGWVQMRSMRAEGGEPAFTELVFVYSGRRWERVYGRFCTVLGAARLTTRFVREVVGDGNDTRH